MKKVIITIIVFIFSTVVYSQDISGNWRWNSDNGKNLTEITLVKVDDNNFKGNYCSSYYDGKKMDCKEENNTDFCIFIHKVSLNIFEGTFESSFSNTMGNIRVTFIPSSNKIKLEILSEPTGEFYFPTDVLLKK